jgi:hypothetical protein
MTKKQIGAVVTNVLHDGKDKNLQVATMSDGRVAYLFDPKKILGPSKSGKTQLVSTTSGALKLNGLPTIAVNIFQK